MVRTLALSAIALGSLVLVQARTNRTNAERLGPAVRKALVLVDTQLCRAENVEDAVIARINGVLDRKGWDTVFFVLDALPHGQHVNDVTQLQSVPRTYDLNGRLCDVDGTLAALFSEEFLNKNCSAGNVTIPAVRSFSSCRQGTEEARIHPSLTLAGRANEAMVVYKGTSRIIEAVGAFQNQFEVKHDVGPQELGQGEGDFIEKMFFNNENRIARLRHAETGLGEMLFRLGTNEVFLAGFGTRAMTETINQAVSFADSFDMTVTVLTGATNADLDFGKDSWEGKGINFIDDAAFSELEVRLYKPKFVEVSPILPPIMGGFFGAFTFGAILFFVMTQISDEG